MNVVVLKTNIHSAERLEPLLSHHDHVSTWSVDLEDIDRVLRIETTQEMDEIYFHSLLTQHGLEVELMVE